MLPLVDEANPKCTACHAGFGSMEELREHRRREHGEPGGEKGRSGPAPGDVSLF